MSGLQKADVAELRVSGFGASAGPVRPEMQLAPSRPVWVPRCPSGKILLPREQPVPLAGPPEHEGFSTSEVVIPCSRCGPRAPH